jgi:hypothetical protein
MTTASPDVAHLRTPCAVSLDGKTFAGVTNAPTGQVSGSTRFHYRQDANVIWADYAGGDIVRGFLIGTREGDRLHFRYTHLDTDHATANGVCESRITMLVDGRVRLAESWSWESRPEQGTSVVEELHESD